MLGFSPFPLDVLTEECIYGGGNASVTWHKDLVLRHRPSMKHFQLFVLRADAVGSEKKPQSKQTKPQPFEFALSKTAFLGLGVELMRTQAFLDFT